MRSDEWMAAFGDQLPEDEETKALVLDGSIEICPICGGLSAYAFQNSTAYAEFDNGLSCSIPGGFTPD